MFLTTQLTCACGRLFEVPSELTTTRVACPTCTRVLFVPDSSVGATKPLDTGGMRVLEESGGFIPVEWRVGDVYLDLYEVRGFIGAGGMGKVYRVYHRVWDLEIAVKCPNPNMLAQLGGNEYFERECSTWVNLGLHPHLVTCYYVRRVSGVPRIFAEYVDSGDLLHWIDDGRLYAGGNRKALSRILCVALQCAWALSYAHAQGIAHRDIKPSNILLTRDAVAKVTDFGLAKSLQALGGGDRKAAPLQFSGLTPAYCAPEQLQRGVASEQSDTWSWAVTVLHMFTRRIVWPNGPAAAQTLADVRSFMTGDESVPALPDQLGELLQRCLQYEPPQRPQSMATLAEELEAIYQGTLGAPCPCSRPAQAVPRAENLNNQGVSFEDLGEHAQAERAWQEALAISPNHAESTFNSAVQRWRAAGISDEDALHLVERTAQHAASRTEMLAEIHLERGDCEAALELLQTHHPESLLIAVAQSCLPSSRRIRLRLHHHADALQGVQVSAEHNLILTASHDNSIHVIDLQTGTIIRTLTGHTNSIDCLWVSSDFRLALSGAKDRTVRAWDVNTGDCLLAGHGDWTRINAVALGNEGASVLVAVDQNRIHWLDRITGHFTRVTQGPAGQVHLIALSKGGRKAVSLHDGGVLHIWDTETGKVERSLQAPSASITCLVYDRDSQGVAAGTAQGQVLCWSGETPESPRVFSGHKGVVHAIAFSHDASHLLSGDGRGRCRLWEIASGRCHFTLLNDSTPIHAVALSEDGAWAVAGNKSGLVAVWELRVGLVYRAAPLRLSRSVSMEVSASQEQRFLSAVNLVSDALALGDVPRAMEDLTRLRDDAEAGSRAETLSLWTRLYRFCRKTGLQGNWSVAALQGHSAPVTRLAWSRDNRTLFSADEAGILRRWDVETGTCVYEQQAHAGPILDLSVKESKHRVVTAGADRLVHCWGSDKGEKLHTLEGHPAPVASAQISPCGSFVISSGWDIRLWDSDTGRNLHTLEGSVLDIRTVRWGPDGQFFIAGGGEKVYLWHAGSLKSLGVLEHRPHLVECVAISPDGRFAVVGCNTMAARDAAVYVWDLRTKQCVSRHQGTSSRIRAIDVAADAEHWVAVNQEGFARIWKFSSSECCDAFSTCQADASTAALARDGALLAVGEVNGTIQIRGLDWELVYEKPHDWEERIRPYLECCLRAQSGAGRTGSHRGARLSRYLVRVVGKTAAATSQLGFDELRATLALAGFGWLTAEQVESAARQNLARMESKRSNSR